MKVVIPYLTALSKNRKFLGAKYGRLIQSPQYKNAKKEILAYIQDAYEQSNEIFVDKKKLYISAFFYRPDLRSDIQNFQEAICDVISDVVKVNDRYFAFKEWDWRVDKENPRIFLEINQD